MRGSRVRPSGVHDVDVAPPALVRGRVERVGRQEGRGPRNDVDARPPGERRRDGTGAHNRTPLAFARRLIAILARFEDEEMPYRSLVSPMWKTRYGDYDHLARVKEWSAAGGLEEDDAGVTR